MIVTFVHVWVKDKYIQDFIKVSAENHKESIKEPGNLRFDLVQEEGNPSKFVFYEAYESEEDIIAHKSTQHYLKWRETVADWMAQPREGIKHKILCPEDKTKW